MTSTDTDPSTQVTLLPDALKVARRAAKMSQFKLAKAAGVSNGYVAMIELGQRQPRMDVVQRLAEALDVPVTAIAVVA